MARKNSIFSSRKEESPTEVQEEKKEETSTGEPSMQVVTDSQLIHLKLDRILDLNMRMAGTIMALSKTCEKTLKLIEQEISKE